MRALLRDETAPPPRYLFLAATHNNRGRHSYPKTTVTRRLKQLGELADIRDSQGRRPPLSNVHRLRHTRATSLINAGVPVHVVQRYLGHLSSEMTMGYAHTLRETHEREFLRYKKITADGGELERQAHRPRAAKRALHAPAQTDVRPRERVPDLRQVHH